VADAVARGWNGDRVQVWQKEEEALFAGVLAFDSKSTASRFVRQVERLFCETWNEKGKTEKHRCKAVHHQAGADHLVLSQRENQLVLLRGTLPAECDKMTTALWKSAVNAKEE